MRGLRATSLTGFGRAPEQLDGGDAPAENGARRGESERDLLATCCDREDGARRAEAPDQGQGCEKAVLLADDFGGSLHSRSVALGAQKSEGSYLSAEPPRIEGMCSEEHS